MDLSCKPVIQNLIRSEKILLRFFCLTFVYFGCNIFSFIQTPTVAG